MQRLIPFFTITHPTRGDLPGPFSRLKDPSTRRLALDVAVTIGKWVPESEWVKLNEAVEKASRETDAGSYWIEVRTLNL